MVDNDICGKASSYGIIRECGFKIILNSADSKTAAVIEACAEAYCEKLVLADLVLISYIVEGSVACVIVLLVLGIF